MNRLLVTCLLAVGTLLPWSNAVSSETNPVQKRMLRLINLERKQRGARILTIDETLTKVAKAQASYMAGAGRLTHRGRRGRWPWTRARLAGYPGEANENVGFSDGDTSASGIHDAFMRSSGHKKNLINPQWRKVGVCRVTSRHGTYWAVLFGA